jgi:hypothetical protein
MFRLVAYGTRGQIIPQIAFNVGVSPSPLLLPAIQKCFRVITRFGRYWLELLVKKMLLKIRKSRCFTSR